MAVEKLLESMRLFLKSKPGPDAEGIANSEADAEAIKKQFEGFKERNPEEYDRLQKQMEHIRRQRADNLTSSE